MKRNQIKTIKGMNPVEALNYTIEQFKSSEGLQFNRHRLLSTLADVKKMFKGTNKELFYTLMYKEAEQKLA